MSELYCKWVSEDMTTRNDTKWEVGVPNELPEKENLKLCSNGLFHYYKHPLLASIFKICCGCKDYTKLYEVKPEGKIVEDWDKSGATKLTLIKKLNVPEISNSQKVALAILCSLEVYKEPNYVNWAEKWLSGENRSCRGFYSRNIIKNIEKTFVLHNPAYHAGYYASIISNLLLSQNRFLANSFCSSEEALCGSIRLSYSLKNDINLCDLSEKAMNIPPTKSFFTKLLSVLLK